MRILILIIICVLACGAAAWLAVLGDWIWAMCLAALAMVGAIVWIDEHHRA